MCEHGLTREIVIERRLEVDACIAEQIVQLNRLGIYTTGCCCGHGKMPATATILPSAQTRARELGFAVTNLSIRLDSWPAAARDELARVEGEAANTRAVADAAADLFDDRHVPAIIGDSYYREQVAAQEARRKRVVAALRQFDPARTYV